MTSDKTDDCHVVSGVSKSFDRLESSLGARGRPKDVCAKILHRSHHEQHVLCRQRTHRRLPRRFRRARCHQWTIGWHRVFRHGVRIYLLPGHLYQSAQILQLDYEAHWHWLTDKLKNAKYLVFLLAIVIFIYSTHPEGILP